MSTVSNTACTADELLHMPDGDCFELVNGELVEKNMGAVSGWVGNKVSARLDHYSETSGGWAFGDGVGYRCYEDPEQVRKPDASFVRAGRFENDELPEGFITIPPDLAVEVVSPNDRYYEVETKVEEYLEAGVLLVWVINPDNRNVRVFRQGRPPVQLGVGDELTGNDVLPGFRCAVAELFPPKPAARVSAKSN